MEKKKLQRDLKREALLRMEAGARTTEDFEGVTEMWDKLDDNRERRERRKEISCPHETMYRAPGPNTDLLDIIYNNAEDMHLLIEDADVSANVQGLSAKRKDVLYMHRVRVLTNQQIAALKGQTDRNILKMYTGLIATLQDKLFVRCCERIKTGPAVTTTMKKFMIRSGWEEEKQNGLK